MCTGNFRPSEALHSRPTGAAVPALCRCARTEHRGLQKESLWALGSVAGSPGPAGVTALQTAGAMPVLVALLKGGAFDLRKEAAFALANAAAGVCLT